MKHNREHEKLQTGMDRREESADQRDQPKEQVSNEKNRSETGNEDNREDEGYSVLSSGLGIDE